MIQYFETIYYIEGKRQTINLEQNEAVFQDTMVGFLEKEAEPVNFLTIGDTNSVDTNGRAGFMILMSNQKNFYSRSAYTFLTLLGDFGGFNDAIVFLISLFMGGYSAKMYAAQIASELFLHTEPSSVEAKDMKTL